jgi:hypothetical protein
MEKAQLALIFFALLSVVLYTLGVMLAIGVVQMLAKGKAQRPVFKALGWPWWILRAVLEGKWN